jgi:hypothetical protein
MGSLHNVPEAKPFRKREPARLRKVIEPYQAVQYRWW